MSCASQSKLHGGHAARDGKRDPHRTPTRSQRAPSREIPHHRFRQSTNNLFDHLHPRSRIWGTRIEQENQRIGQDEAHRRPMRQRVRAQCHENRQHQSTNRTPTPKRIRPLRYLKPPYSRRRLFRRLFHRRRRVSFHKRRLASLCVERLPKRLPKRPFLLLQRLPIAPGRVSIAHRRLIAFRCPLRRVSRRLYARRRPFSSASGAALSSQHDTARLSILCRRRSATSFRAVRLDASRRYESRRYHPASSSTDGRTDRASSSDAIDFHTQAKTLSILYPRFRTRKIGWDSRKTRCAS